MKRFLFSAAALLALYSAPAHAQISPAASGKTPARTTTAASDRSDLDDWNSTTPAPAADGWSTAADATSPASAADPMMQSSGVLVAPGMSSSPYRATSTDYHGRPVAKAKSKRPRSVRHKSDDPMMASSGVMIAPGMNTAPYRGTSTDYHGRPVRRLSGATSVTANTSAGSAW
ncbi:hypothetical protein [Hymenobacter weizhouensis]|uniref:hypothetical protein n=1 Tax=Hymenobacter sp. YIM 151500-1 TaxID=2987689 RepID=UPI0022275514|nr:hypothetical protein [Hymenobacter sp. YIM 151500-1]UYZ62517.1 hypothetical protein OIS53_16145 [Hymenobacter sp. YIM 151500-1]